ncbi:MAG: peptide deformylase [Patescibacteria group bacterium]
MANILEIKTDPDPLLRKVSSPIDKDTISKEDFKQLCRDMIETMQKKDGIGLAAPQIGKNIRIIAINGDNSPFCLINPEITKRSFAKKRAEEGCLSLPNIFGEVQRHKKINCVYLDKNGKKQKIQATDLTARVLQHEIDHLDGILFIDKAENIKEEKGS